MHLKPSLDIRMAGSKSTLHGNLPCLHIQSMMSNDDDNDPTLYYVLTFDEQAHIPEFHHYQRAVS